MPKKVAKKVKKKAAKKVAPSAVKVPARKAANKKTAKKATQRPTPASASGSKSAAQLIDDRIAELGDWRGDALAHLRKLIKQALPNVLETWKWRGTPVWEHNGIVCTGESYKSYLKLTFAKGAALPDPKGLFNASLDGNVRRAIDIHIDDKIDEQAFGALIKAAAAANDTGKKRP